MNIFKEVKDIDALAKKLKAKMEAREDEDEPVGQLRTTARPLKANKVYSEADMEKYLDDNERAESIRRSY